MRKVALGITGWSLRPRLVLAQTWTVPPLFEPHVAPGSDAETHVAAILQQRAPKTSLEQALIVQQITDAVYASAAQGVAVELAP